MNLGNLCGAQAKTVMHHSEANSALLCGVQAEIVKAHGLVGLNQLLLSGTPSGKAAGAALVARLAPSPAFARTDARGPLLVSLAAAVAQPSAATRVAAAGARLPCCL